MEGLLSQAQGSPQAPSPMPTQPGIPAMGASPMMPDSPMEGAPTDGESSPEVTELLNGAVDNIYSKERLPKLKQLFQESGTAGFPQAMGIAVTEGLADIPEGTPDEILSEVGVKLFEMVADDIISSGILDNTYDSEGITPAILVEAAKETLKMWAARNPGRFNEAEFVQAWEAELASEGGMDDIVQGQRVPDEQPMGGLPQAPQAPQGLLKGGM